LNRGFVSARLGNLHIRVSVLLPATVVVSYFTDTGLLYITTMLSVCVHEAGHVALAKLLGSRLTEVRILPYGLNAVIRDEMSAAGRLAVYTGGPVTSMLLFVVFKAMSPLTGNGLMAYVADINLFIALVNLFPALPLDGGKMLREFLGIKAGMNAAGEYLRVISLLAAVAAAVLAAVTALQGSLNISLWAGMLFIIASSGRELTEGRALSIINILNRRSRLLKKGILPVRHITALSTVKLGEIICNMDFERFHIVYVLGPDASIDGTYTEQQLMEGAVMYGSGTTLGEYIRKSKAGGGPDYGNR
jgi:stage IV sporulation protein FB